MTNDAPIVGWNHASVTFSYGADDTAVALDASFGDVALEEIVPAPDRSAAADFGDRPSVLFSTFVASYELEPLAADCTIYIDDVVFGPFDSAR